MVNLAAAMTGILLWVLLNQSRKIYVGMGMGIIAAGVFLLLAANRSLREKFFDIFRGVWGNLQEGPAEVTGAGILLAIFWYGQDFSLNLFSMPMEYFILPSPFCFFWLLFWDIRREADLFSC